MSARPSRTTIAHVYGTGNVFADAESRGKDALVQALVRALKVNYVRLPLSQRASQFIADVRERHHVVVNKRARSPPSFPRRRNPLKHRTSMSSETER